MDYKKEYDRWVKNVKDKEIYEELLSMDESWVEDAFYRELSFGTGGLRGTIGAGTNRMNIYVVAKATQGLANYLGAGASVVIGYDSRIKSHAFANCAATVLAANGIKVKIWPELTPVPTVSFAVRKYKASAGIMITASHNPSKYNGYKVYGPDGCQITTEAAAAILEEIIAIDTFADVKYCDFLDGVNSGNIEYIPDTVLTSFIEEVKGQSVLFGDEINRDVAIVYSPLNGTGLKPVTRALKESGFTNITVVSEQELPDGNFPTCPYPNPEVREAMELGLQYCAKTGADLLLATDPDCDRCGIAVKTSSGDYQLLTGNEVGLLMLDYICSQRVAHGQMPANPVFVKTIVTMDLAEKIATHYGVSTVNVLTGFKFIGEVIGRLEAAGRETDYICGFEESYGYLTGTYVRDKDGVNATFMICEMFAFYKTRGVSLLEKLDEIYRTYGYCLNTLHSYEFDGSAGIVKMQGIMDRMQKEFAGADEGSVGGPVDGAVSGSASGSIGGLAIDTVEDYNRGLNGLPKSNVLKIKFDGGSSVVVRPSGTEPKVKVYVSVIANGRDEAETVEKRIAGEMEERMG